MEMNKILDFVMSMGIAYRSPKNIFFKSGNEVCLLLKPFGICDYDNEDFYHKPYSPFFCHIPNCNRSFDTVVQYESHYNSCHSFTCCDCKKNFPNYHLLDLHITETHDFFFKELAKRKNMYKCFLEECKECFKTSEERRHHCIGAHNFPSDFRFDAARKKTNKIKKNYKDQKKTVNKGLEREISNEKKNKTEENKKTEGIMFANSQGKRKPVLQNFSKDLMKSLSDT